MSLLLKNIDLSYAFGQEDQILNKINISNYKYVFTMDESFPLWKNRYVL